MRNDFTDERIKMKDYCRKYYKRTPSRHSMSGVRKTTLVKKRIEVAPLTEHDPVLKKKFNISTWDHHLADDYLDQ
jgi:hypothetical protein